MKNLLWKKGVPITKIKSFEFSYTNGYFMNANIVYSLRLKNDQYLASFKPLGVPREEAMEKEVGEGFREKIEETMKKYQVGKWDDFHKSNPFVLDGDSFHLMVSMDDKTEINALGYME